MIYVFMLFQRFLVCSHDSSCRDSLESSWLGELAVPGAPCSSCLAHACRIRARDNAEPARLGVWGEL